MRTLLLALGAGVALGFTAITAAQAQDAVGTVTVLHGAGNAVRNNAEQVLKIGAPVFSGDIVETGQGGNLRITFNDNTQLTLGPNAEVLIDDFVYRPGAVDSHAVLRIAAGAARVVAGAVEKVSGRDALKVETPVATIGIRGTDFFIELEGRHLSVALFSGFEIVVSNNAGSTVLQPGEGTDVWDATAPTPGLPWGTERVNRAFGIVSATAPDRRPLPYARPVADGGFLAEALTGGDISLEARYRFESVDQKSFPRNAYASTFRLRLGYETLAWQGLYAGVEGEATRQIGEARRSDGVINRPDAPPIPDPDSEVLNQLYAGWTLPGADGMVGTRAVVGRQRLVYDNERWVGPGSFRQNDQTFDTATIETRAVPHVSLRYAYVDRVNRILGNNPGGHWRSNSHLLSAATDLVPYGITTAYAYLLDLKPVPGFSSATYGVRYDTGLTAGDKTFNFEAEIARQTDYAANPGRYAVTYALLRPSVRWRDTTLYAGIEVLGGNGVNAVQTPLGTLHRHNGWADIFTVTPPAGLRDIHVRATQTLPDLGFVKDPKLDLRFHHFASDGGGTPYGTEFDADFNLSLRGYATVGARFARYDAQNFASDTTKVWMYVEVRY